jgi:prophage antirepressor-like protein
MPVLVSPENNIRVESLFPEQRVLVNEIEVSELIFGSKMPLAKEFRNYVFGTILPSFRKQLLDNQPVIQEAKPTKPIGNPMMIMNEFDLQVKLVSFLRNCYPDV